MTTNESRLSKFLDAKIRAGFGWIKTYEDSLGHERPSMGWLCGHYMSMLADLIDAIGEDRAESLISALDDIDSEIAQQKARGAK